jgi:Tn3 transposase DDE domain
MIRKGQACWSAKVGLLKTLDDEEYRRRMGRELNKGEASHDLSRFLCFGKEGAVRGREFGDQIHTLESIKKWVPVIPANGGERVANPWNAGVV